MTSAIEAAAAAAAAARPPAPLAGEAHAAPAVPAGPLLADISNPGTSVISGPGLEAFAFYFGGDTPHVWTRGQIAAQQLRYAVPVWVYGLARGAAGGSAEGQDAAAALRSLGVPPHAKIAIRVDMETLVDVEYLRAFRTEADLAGYWFGVYGSASTVFANPHGGGGYWVADWTGHPHEASHPSVWATQYADTAQDHQPWDLSEMTSTAHCWDRRPAPAPAPVPQPPAWIHLVETALAGAAADVANALAEIKAHA